MKFIWGWIGTGIFWLMWPVWYFYLRFSGPRSRILVVVGEEILLIQGWLGIKQFGLPGGGTKKRENTITAAVRELYEETGIKVMESGLQKLGSHTHKSRKLRYKADFYTLHLNEKPPLKISRIEIFSARWVSINRASDLNLEEDVSYALKRYRPPEQASLL